MFEDVHFVAFVSPSLRGTTMSRSISTDTKSYVKLNELFPPDFIHHVACLSAREAAVCFNFPLGTTLEILHSTHLICNIQSHADSNYRFVLPIFSCTPKNVFPFPSHNTSTSSICLVLALLHLVKVYLRWPCCWPLKV